MSNGYRSRIRLASLHVPAQQGGNRTIVVFFRVPGWSVVFEKQEEFFEHGARGGCDLGLEAPSIDVAGWSISRFPIG